MKPNKSRKKGAPPKVAGGLSKVLYVRASGDLLDALDALVEKERETRPGRTISRADIARDLLYQAVRTAKD
jgi:hypothetical protein